MDMPKYPTQNRCETLAGLAATAAAITFPNHARAAVGAPQAATLLDDAARRLLALKPEGATSLGLDSGAHSALRGKLEDRSAAGQAAVAALLREDLARIEAASDSTADPVTRTSLAVVKSAYLDVPRFLDADHAIETAADAEAYLARLAQFPAVLAAKTERLQQTAAQGVIAQRFLIEKAIRWGSWVICSPSRFAPVGWWSIPGCMPETEAASWRLTGSPAPTVRAATR